MTSLSEVCCYALKNMADPLLLLSSANQNTSSGEIIGNSLVLSLLEQERSRDKCDIIELRLADRSWRVANLYMVGK